MLLLGSLLQHVFDPIQLSGPSSDRGIHGSYESLKDKPLKGTQNSEQTSWQVFLVQVVLSTHDKTHLTDVDNDARDSLELAHH